MMTGLPSACLNGSSDWTSSELDFSVYTAMSSRLASSLSKGMPEMYFASAIIAADPVLNTTTTLVTDGRFSGAMKGPCVGHVTPEAMDGGPIAQIEEGDLIEIHVPERRLAIVGIRGQRLPTDEIEHALAERRTRWTALPPRHTGGILSLYARVARSSSEGASLT